MRFHHALLLTATLSGMSCGLFPEEAPPEPIRTTPAVQTVRLEISGMHCGLTDGTRLYEALDNLEWVDACQIDFPSRIATLRAREDRIDPVSLWRAVGDLGYEVRLASGVDAPPESAVEAPPVAEPAPLAATPALDEDDFFGPELPVAESDPQPAAEEPVAAGSATQPAVEPAAQPAPEPATEPASRPAAASPNAGEPAAEPAPNEPKTTKEDETPPRPPRGRATPVGAGTRGPFGGGE